MFAAILAAAVQSAAPASPKYAFEEPPQAVEPAGPIETVMLHPLFAGHFVCGEHAAGQKSIAGDALGTDCQVLGREGASFRRLYRSDGLRNEDWYSWGADVLSPADGVVTGLLPNPRVNEPGTMGRPPAGMMQIRRDDGITVMIGHLTDFAVALGARVKAGQRIAKVGNNGPSFAPHVHIGAARGSEPLQIRWDQRAMGALMPAE